MMNISKKEDFVNDKNKKDFGFKMQSESLLPMDGPSETIDTNAIADLDRLLTKSTQPLSNMAIDSAKELFNKVKLQYITNEQVTNLFNRLPRIDHLDYHTNTFGLLGFLFEKKEFAELFNETQFLHSIDFSHFDLVPDATKTVISEMALNMMTEIEDSITIFYENFYPSLYSFLQKPDFYKSEGLHIHLSTAAKFIPFLKEEDQVQHIFSRFTLFIQHTQPEVSHSALLGIMTTIKNQCWILHNSDFYDTVFIDRLYFLGSHKNDQTGPYVMIVIQYILLNNIDFPKYFHGKICQLIIEYLAITSQDYSGRRIEAISLLSFAFYNQYFVENTFNPEEVSLFDKLIESFIQNYPTFKMKEKVEASRAIANFFGFVKPEIVAKYVQDGNFTSILLEFFDLDDPEIILPLINGLHRALYGGLPMFDLEQKSALYNAIIVYANSEQENLAHAVHVICKELQAP